MALKKKLTGLSKLLLLLPFMLLFVNLSTTCNAQTNYQLTGDDLKKIWSFGMQQSIDLLPDGYSSSNSIINVWNTVDAVSGDRNWDVIAQSFSDYLYNQLSGDDTANFSDFYLICWAQPQLQTVSTGSDKGFYFIFVPYPYRTIKATETRNTYTYSGETKEVFQHTLTSVDIYGNTTSSNNYYVLYIPYALNSNVTYYNTKQYILNGFKNFYPSKYSWYLNSYYTYAYGILGLYRTNEAVRVKEIYYQPVDSNLTNPYFIHYRMNLDNQDIISGDTEPTPTPEPSGSGGSVDLTETNDLISNVESTVNSLVSAVTEDFNISGELITSGEIIDSIGVPKFNNPHTNVWFHLTTGLYNALLGVNREIEFDLFNETHTINLDDIGWEYPLRVQTMLQTISTCCMVWILIRYWHKITDKLQSGDIDSILLESSEEGIVNLF